MSIRNTGVMLALFPFALCGAVAAEEYEPSEANLAAREWFQNARFGLFVHWGVYSVEGRGEWLMNNERIGIGEYEKLPPRFNPTQFDADAWCEMAKDAGMRYITITSKHHDGFAMFKSKISDYDIVDQTPYKTDVLNQEKVGQAASKVHISPPRRFHRRPKGQITTLTAIVAAIIMVHAHRRWSPVGL